MPSILVLLVGSELIRNSADRWFNAPMDEILSSANRIAADYYAERQRLRARAGRAHREDPGRGGSPVGDVPGLQDRLGPEVAERSPQARRGVSRHGRRRAVARGPDSRRRLAEPAAGALRASAERLASHVATGAGETWALEPMAVGGELLRGAAAVRAPDGRITGVVVASDYLTGELAARSRRMTAAYEDYRQLRVLKAPLFGVYVSFFLMVTLMILVGATWMGLYLAKRITRPVQLLAAAAREIGAGHLDHRVEPRRPTSSARSSRPSTAWPRNWRPAARTSNGRRSTSNERHLEGEGRRRYIETILERIATGVISIDERARSARSTTRPGGCWARRRSVGRRRGGLRAGGPRAAVRAAAIGRRRRRGVAAAGDRAHPGRPRSAPGGGVHGLDRRRRPHRGGRPRVRRRDAAHPVAEGGGLAGSRAPPRARDQEPAHADPALGRTPAAAFRHGAASRLARSSTNAPRPS